MMCKISSNIRRFLLLALLLSSQVVWAVYEPEEVGVENKVSASTSAITVLEGTLIVGMEYINIPTEVQINDKKPKKIGLVVKKENKEKFPKKSKTPLPPTAKDKKVSFFAYDMGSAEKLLSSSGSWQPVPIPIQLKYFLTNPEFIVPAYIFSDIAFLISLDKNFWYPHTSFLKNFQRPPPFC